MVQITTSGFVNMLISGSLNPLNGVLISWPATVSGSANFFTINSSVIGGNDFIPGTGSFPTFLDKYTYTDYSDHLISWSATRSFGQYPYGQIVADATVILDNTDNLFTPSYDPTIGAYVSLPNRPVKLSTGINNSYSDEYILQFAGYTSPPELDAQQRQITLNCFDGMNYLNGFTSITTPVQINQRFDQILATLLSEAGFGVNQYVLEQSLQQPIGYFSPYNLTIGSIIQMGCEAEQGLAFFDENGVFHFWNRQHLANNNSPVWTFSNNNIESFQTMNTPVLNDIIIQANPRAVAAKQQIWQLSTATLVPAGASATISADFNDDNGALPVTAVDTPTYYNSSSASLTSNYTANTNSDGSGIDGSPYISAGVPVLKGTNCQVTFTNSFSSPVYITQLSLYGTPAKVTVSINQEYSDANSILLYGMNPANNYQPFTIQNDLIQNADTAHSNAYQLVTDYKQANVRIQAIVFAAPQLQLGDCVARYDDDTAITTNYTVVGITNDATSDEGLKQTLILEIKQLVSYFTINVSTIGSSDQIAP